MHGRDYEVCAKLYIMYIQIDFFPFQACGQLGDLSAWCSECVECLFDEVAKASCELINEFQGRLTTPTGEGRSATQPHQLVGRARASASGKVITDFTLRRIELWTLEQKLD